jgi:sigma-E factor negative regulatory protein RseA
MTERVSALMDGELSGDDAGREASLLRTDEQARRAWNTYHLIGDALRGDLHREYDHKIMARLAGEPVVLAPQPRRPWQGGADQPIGRNRDWRLVRYALSAAASVAGVALVVWTAAPVLTPPAEMQLARTTQPVPRPVLRDVGTAKGVENYLLAHQSYSPSNAMQGVAPYVRLVSEQRAELAK